MRACVYVKKWQQGECVDLRFYYNFYGLVNPYLSTLVNVGRGRSSLGQFTGVHWVARSRFSGCGFFFSVSLIYSTHNS